MTIMKPKTPRTIIEGDEYPPPPKYANEYFYGPLVIEKYGGIKSYRTTDRRTDQTSHRFLYGP